MTYGSPAGQGMPGRLRGSLLVEDRPQPTAAEGTVASALSNLLQLDYFWNNLTAAGAVERTGSGTGAGTSTATGVLDRQRTAAGTGAGSSTATGLVIRVRTASGAGVGVSTASGFHSAERTGVGSALSGGSAVGVRTAFGVAVATGVGSGTASGARTVERTASGAGFGSGVASAGVVITGSGGWLAFKKLRAHGYDGDLGVMLFHWHKDFPLAGGLPAILPHWDAYWTSFT